MIFRTRPETEMWRHTVHSQVMRCSQVNCTCLNFQPQPFNIRSCDHCQHGWVTHAVSKCVCTGQPEVVRWEVVRDLSALVLMGTNALPVRMKILLDRLFSVLTHTHVLQILHTHGWSLHDYTRGYMLQDPAGKVLDTWEVMTPEDELVTLQQFRRFGETRSIVELMAAQQDHARLPEIFRTTRRDSGVRLLPESHDATTENVTGGERSAGLDHCTERLSSLSGRRLRAGPHPALKARASCGSCGKSFYDRGTLKIHYNAVHLQIKHRCTVQGCDMVFSSLRSRNRHSANPNPRLHTPAPRDANPGSYPDSSRSSASTPERNTAMLALLSTSHTHVDANARNYTHMLLSHNNNNNNDNAVGGASDHLPANQELTKTIDVTPKKKKRKSSMPVRILDKRENQTDHANEDNDDVEEDDS